MAPSVPDRVRPTVLVLLGSYLPAYKAGGPIRSVANMVAAIGEEFNFKVVTLDRDLGDKLPFPGTVANQWVRIGNAEVMYLRPGFHGLLSLYALLRSIDKDTVLYLNSFFDRHFSMVAVLMRRGKLCRPRWIVLAPRGEFSLGALEFRNIRKRVYIRVSQWLGLYRNLIWQASSDFEVTDIQRQFPQARRVAIASVIPGEALRYTRPGSSQITIATDVAGVTTLVRQERCPKMPGTLRAVFVSRVSPKKNLVGALKMLNGVSGDVSFDIYGPAEDTRYWNECQRLIAELPANVCVKYYGQIEHAKISQVFRVHDLFLFPTLGENFGHVICEALVAGCPVLISDQTPWRDLEALQVGWDLPLSEPKRFRDILQQCVDMGSEEYNLMCTRVASFGAVRANSPAVIEQNRALFHLAGNIRPQMMRSRQ